VSDLTPLAWRTRLVDSVDGFECSWQTVSEEPPKETVSRVVRRETIPLYGPEALARIEELEGRLAKAVMGLQRIDAEARDAAAMAEAGYRVSAGTVAVAAYEVSTATLSSIQDKTDD